MGKYNIKMENINLLLTLGLQPSAVQLSQTESKQVKLSGAEILSPLLLTDNSTWPSHFGIGHWTSSDSENLAFVVTILPFCEKNNILGFFNSHWNKDRDNACGAEKQGYKERLLLSFSKTEALSILSQYPSTDLYTAVYLFQHTTWKYLL